MTRVIFKRFAEIVRENYPKEQILTNSTQVEIWFELLADIPDELCMKALKEWIANNKWAPHVSDIREYAAKAMQGPVKDWGSAWATVETAIRRYGMYNEAEAMESLDDITREVVKNLGFKSLCLSEADRIEFIKSQFKDLYNRKLERNLHALQTPQHLQIGTEGQQLIGG